MDFEKLAASLVKRLSPGKGPEPESPHSSVMHPKYRDPLGKDEAARGLARSALGIPLGLPDAVVSGMNTSMSPLGLGFRALFGRQELPGDRAAKKLDLVGSGPAYDFGRAAGDATQSAMGLAAGMKPAGQGTLNMFLGPGAPGYPKSIVKQLAEYGQYVEKTSRKFPEDAAKSIAGAAAGEGLAYDPAARRFLMPLHEVADWKVNPDFQKLISPRYGPNGALPAPPTFEELFIHAPGMNKLPPAARMAPVSFGKNLGAKTAGGYNPATNEIFMGPAAFAHGEDPVSTLIHEGQHAVQQASKFSSGTSPDAVLDVRQNLDSLQLSRDVNKLLKNTLPTPPSSVFADALRAAKFPYTTYRNDVGEIFARAASEMAAGRTPSMNPYNHVEDLGFMYPGKLASKGQSVELLDWLARLNAQHPVLAGKAAEKHLPLQNLSVNENLYRELLGFSRPFGVNPEK